jgi:hypothetical protein
MGINYQEVPVPDTTLRDVIAQQAIRVFVFGEACSAAHKEKDELTALLLRMEKAFKKLHVRFNKVAKGKRLLQAAYDRQRNSLKCVEGTLTDVQQRALILLKQDVDVLLCGLNCLYNSLETEDTIRRLSRRLKELRDQIKE